MITREKLSEVLYFLAIGISVDRVADMVGVATSQVQQVVDREGKYRDVDLLPLPQFIPTPEQIHERADAIRACWTNQQEMPVARQAKRKRVRELQEV